MIADTTTTVSTGMFPSVIDGRKLPACGPSTLMWIKFRARGRLIINHRREDAYALDAIV